MGKKILKASAWTCRPLLFFCHKAVTLIFALFCIVSGIFARTAEETTLKGTARSSKDSTILGNLKLYLCSVSHPVYGMGFWPSFFPVDSTITDSDGTFQFNYNGTSYYEMAFVKIDSLVEGDPFRYISAQFFQPVNVPDTFTIYLEPVIRTSSKESRDQKPVPQVQVTQGKRVTINIGNWSGDTRYTAEIINPLGKRIGSPVISNHETLIWNTEQVAPGSYFIRIHATGKSSLVPITVR